MRSRKSVNHYILTEAYNIPLKDSEDIDNFDFKGDKSDLKSLLAYLTSLGYSDIPLAGESSGKKVKIRGIDNKENQKTVIDWIKINTPSLHGEKRGQKKFQFGKGSISSSPSPTGEDWEAMIAVGIAKLSGKNPSKSNPDEWDRVKDYWMFDHLRNQAESLAKTFISKGYSPLEQTGSGKGGAGVSPIWAELYKKHGGKGIMNKTPKTDVLGGGTRISLKKVGGSQVMSSKKQESFATFQAAMLLYGDNYPREVNSILDSFKNDVLDFEGSGYKGSIGSLEKDIEDSEGDSKKMAKLQSYKDDMDEARKNGEELTVKINQLFQNDPKMKQLFIFEAASGITKFGDKSISRAERMVEFEPETGKITTDWSIETPKDIDSIMSKYKFYMSFKSSGASTPYMSLRGNLTSPKAALAFTKKILQKEQVEYTEECPTFSAIMKEAFNQNLYGRTLMLEEYENLNEFQLFQRIKSKVLGSRVGKKFLQIWGWIKQKMSMAFDWIKKQGNKALGYLLKFFGIEPKQVSLSGPIELFTESK